MYICRKRLRIKKLIDLIEYSSTNESESPRVEKGQQK